MSSMPVNYAGLSLIIFGIFFFLLEIKIVSHGLLTIGGIISVLLGSMFLFRQTPTENIVAVSTKCYLHHNRCHSFVFYVCCGHGPKGAKAKTRYGLNALIGMKGEAINLIDPSGMVKVNGEIWNAISVSGKINEGENIIVKEIKILHYMLKQCNTFTDISFNFRNIYQLHLNNTSCHNNFQLR